MCRWAQILYGGYCSVLSMSDAGAEDVQKPFCSHSKQGALYAGCTRQSETEHRSQNMHAAHLDGCPAILQIHQQAGPELTRCSSGSFQNLCTGKLLAAQG